jgi:hypothetical protein
MREVIAFVALVMLPSSACADVWMVKSSGSLGCRDRETLVELDAKPTSGTGDESAPANCVVLYAGERLLDQPEVGAGFNEYIKVQRADGSTVFVRRAGLVSDPGIGSVTDDRAD